MNDSREHNCPRCGAYLPTVTVRVPVYEDRPIIGQEVVPRVLARYDELEEVAECVRCTGAY